MKSQNQTQTLLKFALLAVLAANVGHAPWQEWMKELSLSSDAETATAKPAAPAAPSSQVNPLTKRGEEIQRKSVNLCQQKQLTLIFRKFTMAEKRYTVAYAIDPALGNEGQIIHEYAQAERDPTETVKTALEQNLRASLAKYYSCDDRRASETATTTRSGSTSSSETDREIKENEEKVKRCEMKSRRVNGNKEYVAIEGEKDRMLCHIGRIADLRNARDDRKRRRSDAWIANEAEKIVNNELKSKIKSLLKSKDADENDEGIELAEELIKALERLPDENRKVRKLVGMVTGFKAAGETTKITREREEASKEVRERLVSSREDLRRNPTDFYAQTQWRNALYDHWTLGQDIAGLRFSDPFQTMEAQRRFGYLSSSDYSDFLSPYRSLQKQMEQMVRANGAGSSSSSLLTDLDIARDLYSIRTGSSRGHVRMGGLPSSYYGLSIPDVRSTIGITPSFATGGQRYDSTFLRLP